MAKAAKHSITKGVAKVPVVMQLEALECGAASLAMVMAYYGKWVPLEQVRSDCGVSRDGSNAKNIYLAAQSYGFDVKAFRMNPKSIREKGEYPCIIHWNMNHFVVLNGVRGNRYYINDPARGEVKVDFEEFDRSFTGVTLVPTPSEKFEPGGKRKSTLEFARKRLKGASAAVAFVIITTAIAYLFGVANSVTSRIFMDYLLAGTNLDWLGPFIAVMVALAISQIVVEWVKAVYSLKINGKMSVVGSTSYMWKVLRDPMEFFTQRMPGDIQSRLELNASIAETLVQTFAPLLIDTIMMLIYLVLMVHQSLLLTLVGMGTLVLNIVVSRIIANRRLNIARVQLRDTGKLESSTIMGISMVETIKSAGAEQGFFEQWSGYQASVNKQNVKSQTTDQYLGVIPSLFVSLANYAVLILGILLTMQGNFTLGAVMMFQGFLGSFMSPAKNSVLCMSLISEFTFASSIASGTYSMPTTFRA